VQQLPRDELCEHGDAMVSEPLRVDKLTSLSEIYGSRIQSGKILHCFGKPAIELM
jgi:hypothetical protein